MEVSQLGAPRDRDSLKASRPGGEEAEGRVPPGGRALWQEVCRHGGCEEFMRRRQGLLEAALRCTVLDAEQGALSVPCAVVEEASGQIAYATRGFKDLVGCRATCPEPVLGRTFRECLQPKSTTVDQEVNADRWEKLTGFAEHAELGTSLVLLMLGENSSGKPFWSMVHAFCVCTPSFGCHVVLVVTVLEAPLPMMICQASKDGVFVGDVSLLVSLVDTANAEVQVQVASAEMETISVISQRTERACKALAGKLDESFEGDHFVPMVGYESALSFDKMNEWEVVFGQVEEELRTGWEADDEVYRNTKTGGAKAISCAVADPSVHDCPLVYISSGFETLTQYRRTWALGRNCRFLQPNKRSKNMEFNGDEVKRMKEFCSHSKSGLIVSLLLNEAADRTHFWNLLFLEHIKSARRGHSSGGTYIFAIQSNIVIQKELLDRLVLDVWESGAGKDNLAELREAFRRKEGAYTPKQASLLQLGSEVISSWAMEVGRKESTFWDGDLYVPLFGMAAVKEFAGKWPSLAEHACRGIRAFFEFTDATCRSIQDNSEDAVACAVSDPTSMDFPLVFLTKGFESMTGYRNDFALGRNCRFLQLSTLDLNKTINGDELDRMREFCTQHGPEGCTSLHLLLNERRNGERFWNLLHLQHIQVHSKPYVFGIQTLLDIPMPRILKCRETPAGAYVYDPASISCFSQELAFFLKQLRGQLRGKGCTGMCEKISHATASLTNFIKRTCDDFEGDHLVPRLVREESWISELDATWKSMLHQVKHLLVEIWGTSEYNGEDVACAVSNPMGTDCPLVYVSPRFEKLTGYPREWALGRNCRFLQPNDSRRNTQFNEDDKLRMRAFCRDPQRRGTRIINLLVNETQDGHPFWNVLVMEHVEVQGCQYIFGVQTTIDVEATRMSEILAMDRDGLTELARLRTLLRSRENRLGNRSFKAIVDEIVREWASDLPLHLQMPHSKVSTDCTCSTGAVLPWAALVLTPEQPLEETLQRGMENGIRHFAFSLQSAERLEDSQYVERVGHLFSLRVAEVLNHIRLTYMHYLRAGMVFTLITRPQYVSCVRGIHKALTSCGYCIHCWLLDVRGVPGDKISCPAVVAKLDECYQTMSAALRAGDVKVTGLYGCLASVMAVMELVKRHRRESPIGILAMDDSPGRETEQCKLHRFRRLYPTDYGSPLLATYGLYGAHNSLLDSVALQDRARHLHIDVATMLLKWAEDRHMLALVPRISDVAHETKVSDLPDFHRTFMRQYAFAPSSRCVASEVALAMEGNVARASLDSPRRNVTASPRDARRLHRATTDTFGSTSSHRPGTSGSGGQHSPAVQLPALVDFFVRPSLPPRVSRAATLHLASLQGTPDGRHGRRKDLLVEMQSPDRPVSAQTERGPQQTWTVTPALTPELPPAEPPAKPAAIPCQAGEEWHDSDTNAQLLPNPEFAQEHGRCHSTLARSIDHGGSESESQRKVLTPVPPPVKPVARRNLRRIYVSLASQGHSSQAARPTDEPHHQLEPGQSTPDAAIPSHFTSVTSEHDHVLTASEQIAPQPCLAPLIPRAPLDERTQHLAGKLLKKGWSIEDAAEFFECSTDQLVHIWNGTEHASRRMGG